MVCRNRRNYDVSYRLALPDPDNDQHLPCRSAAGLKCRNAPRRAEREMSELLAAGDDLTAPERACARAMSEYRTACREVGRPYRLDSRRAEIVAAALIRHGRLKG